jgi:hypothetical protein
MRRLAVLAVMGSGLAVAGSAARAGEIATFDSPYKLTAKYASWATKAATLTSNPTNFEVQSTGYGSGCFQIYPSVVDASDGSIIQLDCNVNSGVGGFLVDLDDGEGDEYTYQMGYGLLPGGGINGTNEYILQVPADDPAGIPQGGPDFDFTQITGYNIELDPGSATQSYDVTFNDLSTVNVPEPTSLGIGVLGCTFFARRRRR